MKAVKTTVSIPKPLAEKIKKKLKETSFDSIDSFINYLLEKSLFEMERETFNPKEEKKVKKRLKSLGYLG